MHKIIFTLAAAMIAMSSCTDTAKLHETASPTLCQQAVIDNIMGRTSIRSFTPQAVSQEEVETLLRAGMAAPSACNIQPWRFITLTDSTMRAAITDAMRSARPAAEAPLVIVVCGDMQAMEERLPNDKEYWVQDCSAATENILLTAQAKGLGAVWLGVYPVEERVKTLRTLLGIPSHVIPLAMIAVGHPAESPAPKDKWKPANIHAEKW